MPARPPPEPDEAALVIGRPIADGDVAALCARLRRLAEAGATEVACDAAALEADALGVDALARLQLTARRAGCRLRLRNVAPQLRELVCFCGLERTLPLRLEAQGQPEEREHPLGVEERVDRDDLPA